MLAAAALLGMRQRITPRGVAGWLGASAVGTLSNFSFTLLAPLHAAWWLGAPGAAHAAAGDRRGGGRRAGAGGLALAAAARLDLGLEPAASGA